MRFGTVGTPGTGLSVRLALAFRDSARSVRRAWARSLLVCLVLAAAVAAAQTVFVIRGAIRESTLPYRDSSEIVHVEIARRAENPRVAAGIGSLVTIHEQAQLRQSALSITSLAGWSATWGVLGEDRAQALRIGRIHPRLFETLAVEPARGRLFSAAEYEEAGVRADPPAILLSHDLWRRLGGPSDLPGTEIRFGGVRAPVVGVMLPDFFFPEPGFDAWIPAPDRRPEPWNRGSAHPVIARLASGVSAPAAAAELSSVLLAAGALEAGERVRLIPADEAVTRNLRPALDVLWAGALLLIGVTALSVGAFRLSEETTEGRAAAIRSWLGEDRVQERLRWGARTAIHTGLVATVGVLLGVQFLGIAARISRALPYTESWEHSGAGLLATGLLALGSVTAAESPLLISSLTNPAGPRKSGAGLPVRGVLLGTGVAASTALLISGVIVSGSAWQLLEGRGGYPSDRLVQVTLDFPDRASVLSHEAKTRILDRTMDRLEALPGVLRATYADGLPDGTPRFQYRDDGSRDQNRASVRSEIRVRPGFLGVLEIPLLRGRGLVEGDRPGDERAAVVSRGLARTLSGNAIGRLLGEADDAWRIVGVARDVSRFPLTTAAPAAYVPFGHPPAAGFGVSRVEIVARLDTEPSQEHLARLAATVAGTDPGLRVLRTESVRARRAGLLGAGSLAGSLIAVYAAVGLLLSAISCFGHITRRAALSRRSNSVRLAVGASPGAVAWETARRTGISALAGLPVGVLAAWLLMRVTGNRIPWIEIGDPLLYAGPAAFLGLLVIASCGLAAYRAGRIGVWRELRAL